MLRFLANVVLALWLVGVLLAVFTLPLWVSSDVSYASISACAGKYANASCSYELEDGERLTGKCRERLHFITCSIDSDSSDNAQF